MEPKSAAKGVYLLLAVAISIGIWFYVDTYGNNGSAFSAQQTVTDIPIEYTGESALVSKGLMLLKDGTSDTVDLTFEGPRLLVIQLDRSRIRVTAELNSISSAGVQTVRCTPSYLDEQGRSSLPATQHFSRVSIIKRDPENATVNISELSRTTVDIRCELTGTVADGYSAGQPQLSQNTVEIQGMEAEISTVSYAKVTMDLGNDIQESVTRRLTCQFYDNSDQLIEDYSFRPMTEQIQVTLPVYVTKDLTLLIDFSDTAGARLRNVSYEIKPPTVTVSGEASRLKGIDSLTIGEFNLANIVESGKRITYHSFSITVPEGCENLSGISRATLQIAFTDMESATVTTSRFVIATELPEGKTAEVLTESLDVSIFGPAAAVESVTGTNLVVTPDLSDYTAAAGVYTVPAKVSVRNTIDVGISGNYEVQVRIQEPESESAETAGVQGASP